MGGLVFFPTETLAAENAKVGVGSAQQSATQERAILVSFVIIDGELDYDSVNEAWGRAGVMIDDHIMVEEDFWLCSSISASEVRNQLRIAPLRREGQTRIPDVKYQYD